MLSSLVNTPVTLTARDPHSDIGPQPVLNAVPGTKVVTVLITTMITILCTATGGHFRQTLSFDFKKC